jgi:hypothetical protein
MKVFFGADVNEFPSNGSEPRALASFEQQAMGIPRSTQSKTDD